MEYRSLGRTGVSLSRRTALALRPGSRVVHDQQDQFEVALRDCLAQVEAHSTAMALATAGTASAGHDPDDEPAEQTPMAPLRVGACR